MRGGDAQHADTISALVQSVFTTVCVCVPSIHSARNKTLFFLSRAVQIFANTQFSFLVFCVCVCVSHSLPLSMAHMSIQFVCRHNFELFSWHLHSTQSLQHSTFIPFELVSSNYEANDITLFHDYQNTLISFASLLLACSARSCLCARALFRISACVCAPFFRTA